MKKRHCVRNVTTGHVLAHFFLVILEWNVSTTKCLASSPGCRESTLPNGANPAPVCRNRTLPRPKQCRTPTRSLASVDKEFDSCQTCALHTPHARAAPCLFRCTHLSASLPSATFPFSAPAETRRSLAGVPDIFFVSMAVAFIAIRPPLFIVLFRHRCARSNNVLNNEQEGLLLIHTY
jgi:hypothetical protein